jgi:hypothetical protein
MLGAYKSSGEKYVRQRFSQEIAGDDWREMMFFRQSSRAGRDGFLTITGFALQLAVAPEISDLHQNCRAKR